MTTKLPIQPKAAKPLLSAQSSRILVNLSLGSASIFLLAFAAIMVLLLTPLSFPKITLLPYSARPNSDACCLVCFQNFLPGFFLCYGALILARCIIAAPARRSVGVLASAYLFISTATALLTLGPTIPIKDPVQKVTNGFMDPFTLYNIPLWVIIVSILLIVALAAFTIFKKYTLWHLSIICALSCLLAPLSILLILILVKTNLLPPAVSESLLIISIFYGLPSLFAAGFLGLVAVTNRKWFLDHIQRATRGDLCPVCTYDITGNPTATTCPECGAALSPTRPLTAPKQP